jgi:hypothetical protein
VWPWLAVVAGLAGCASDDRQWMKLEGSYTSADFRRDWDVCSKGGSVDEACMRARGWVAVRAGKPEQAAVPEAERSRNPVTRRGR